MINTIFRPGLFADQVILVTGGGTGIGRAIARELAHLGATVVIASRSADHLEPTRAEIEAAGGRVAALPLNIRDEEAVKTTLATIVERYGRLDGVVNNGGGQFSSPAAKISAKGWHAVIETNLTGTFYVARAAMETYMKDHGGAIVNIVAEMWRGFPNMAHTGAARAGVVNLTQTLALEWAHYGIRINSVAPGLIDSSGLERYPPEIRAGLPAIAADLPSKRMGTESEVAAATVFMLSPAAAFISGTTLKVDGAGSLYRLQGYVIPEHDPWPSFEFDDD